MLRDYGVLCYRTLSRYICDKAGMTLIPADLRVSMALSS